MEISFRNVCGHTVVELHGSVDFFSINELKKPVSQLISEKTPSIVLDLRDVGYLDSAGIGFVLSAYKAMSRYDGKIGLMNVRDDLLMLLKLATADSLLKIYKSESDLLPL